MAGMRSGRPALRFVTSLVSLAVLWACSKGLPGQEQPAERAQAAVAAPKVKPAGKGPFGITSFLHPDRELEAGDYVWEASGATEGPIRIVADIEAQRVYVYRGTVEIGRSSLIYGAFTLHAARCSIIRGMSCGMVISRSPA